MILTFDFGVDGYQQNDCALYEIYLNFEVSMIFRWKTNNL